MDNKQLILLIGATQGTGFETARLLLDEGHDVRIFARNEEKAKQKFADRVGIVKGDLQSYETIPVAVRGVDHIIFTAGVTKRPCREDLIIKTEFEGIKKTLFAAKKAGFDGKFLFLSSIGVVKSNWASRMINFVKGNALKWRFAMEEEIRKSDLDYTIVRAGYLTNGKNRKGSIALSQTEYPLYLKYRIARRDIARIFVEALKTDEANKKTFEAVWAWPDNLSLVERFSDLKRDS